MALCFPRRDRSRCAPQPEANSTVSDEPIIPVPESPAIDTAKVRLGERLFGDRRLSRDNSHSCLSCHDLSANGATKVSHDVGLDGSDLPLHTLTVFNAALSFRLGAKGISAPCRSFSRYPRREIWTRHCWQFRESQK
ncbi:cytochrome-c peroxidase [Bradyrhizobium sp. AZCC 2230]|uniref:cytochrome-c peroxidase n=1 Tax=Bradyrhizobium sp. AZCC 2230 TaxID=3117021 RepID=UPI002FF1034F